MHYWYRSVHNRYARNRCLRMRQTTSSRKGGSTSELLRKLRLYCVSPLGFYGIRVYECMYKPPLLAPPPSLTGTNAIAIAVIPICICRKTSFESASELPLLEYQFRSVDLTDTPKVLSACKKHIYVHGSTHSITGFFAETPNTSAAT